jgi:hypothetical protein
MFNSQQVAQGRESIFRSIGLGLEGTLSHMCFPSGSHGRVPSLRQSERLRRFFPSILLSSGLAMSCSLICCLSGRLHAVHHRVVRLGEALLKGEGGAPVMHATPGIVWQCLTEPWSVECGVGFMKICVLRGPGISGYACHIQDDVVPNHGSSASPQVGRLSEPVFGVCNEAGVEGEGVE